MPPSPQVIVRVDLSRIRRNAEEIARRTGVAIIAVVKADAYGLGAGRVAEAVRDLVDGFYVFDAAESVRDRLFERTGRRTIALRGESEDAKDYLAYGIQPVVWTVERAAALRRARPILSVDTGQQRFACAIDDAAQVVAAGGIDEAFTHATSGQQVGEFVTGLQHAGLGALKRHAAGSSLLGDPTAWLDAIRPGLALYQGAARVATRLVEVRDSHGPAGYTGFEVPRHGVILAGYSNGLRVGPCRVNGRASRVLEVGMQSAFVECAVGDRVGDEVVLLGDGLKLEAVAAQWNATPHETLLRMAGAGEKEYAAG